MKRRKLIKIIKIRKNDRGFNCIMECLYCKKRFKIRKSYYDLGIDKGKYCSVKCLGKDRLRKIDKIEIKCLNCGKKFMSRNAFYERNVKFCSRKCISEYKSDIIECLNCGKIFKSKKSNKSKYCCKKCKWNYQKISFLGKNNHRYGKSSVHGKGEWYIRKDKTKVWMRSSYEIAFAKWLDKKKLTWEYELKRFYLKDRTYVPDFWIEEWKSWIEIKGWFHKRHQETVRQFREYNPNENLLVLTKPLLEAMKVL